MASSACASSMSRGGSRRTVVGPVAFSTSRCSRSARTTMSAAPAPVAGVELEGEHQPAAADLDDARAARPGRARRRSPSSRTRASSRSSSIASMTGKAGRALHGPAGEGRAVVAGLSASAQALAGDHRADRQPAAERLGERHHVRHDRSLLVREQRAGAPQAALDLVEDQRRAVASQASRAASSTSSSSTWTPPSPWTGSSSTAAVLSVDGRRDRAASSCARPRSRAPAARTAPAWPPAASRRARRYVRPWKPLVARDDLAARPGAARRA